MTELCCNYSHENALGGSCLLIKDDSGSGVNPMIMTGEMLPKPSDEETVVTVPTVVSTCDDDDGCCDDASDAGCGYYYVRESSFSDLHCVSFDEVPQVEEIPNRWEYTADDTETIWYSRREKEVMREAAIGIAKSLDYSYFQDEYGQPASTNFRGLESYTTEGSKERKLCRVKNLVAVLREQRRQRACGEVVTNGPELLEAVCYQTSSRCQKLAQEQAKRDEKDARGEKEKASVDQSPSMMLHLTKLLRDLSG